MAPAPAQSPPPTAVVVDSTVHRLPADGSRLRAMRLDYRATLTRDSTVTPLGAFQVQVSEMQFAGSPAWLLLRSGARGVQQASDSLVVAHSDLRPLHWGATLGSARLGVEFTADSLFGAMTSPLGKQNIMLRNRGDLLVNESAVDFVLATIPLNAAWHDSATVLIVDAGGSTTAPASLRVEGEERITVPAGEYDCWILSLESERGASRLWVSKQDQLLVRAVQILPQLGGATAERVLVHVEMGGSP